MAEGVVSVALETLRDLLVKEARFLSGVSSEVEEIRKELKRTLCFLNDADKKQSEDESIRNWLREIRCLAYRIEDLVETYAVEVGARKSSSGTRSIKKFLKRAAGIFGEIRSLYKLGTEIQKVKRDIGITTTSLQRYDIRAIGGDSSDQNQQYQQWVRQTYDYEVEDYFVGMENDIKSLVSLLTDDNDLHRIISIWGMGGLGKTTLARKVFKHKDVQRRFKRFAWTCVTQQAQIEEILRDILEQLLPEKSSDVKSMKGRQLVRRLHQVQRETKCLVVLDDIWKMDDWESISVAFFSAEGGTKLLLTTRKKEVAEIGLLYELKCLTEKEGWELLQKIVSSRGRTDFEIVPSFRDVGIELVSKCGGLPLAISVLGGILKDKKSLADWETVNANVGSYLRDTKAKGKTVGGVLALSYDELPYHLKLCFLCFGNFKEDEDIEAKELFSLWIAEGLVLSQHQRNGESLMEVAETYLNELGHRSMVQVHKLILSVSCRLHDLMRDLCLEKCIEEEFIEVTDIQDVKRRSRDFFYPNATHRLVIHNIDNMVNVAAKINKSQGNSKQTRSIYLRANWPSIVWPQGITVRNFTMLRVLKFEGFDFGSQQDLHLMLQSFILLKILSFERCKLVELPASVADLPLLQTLDLRGIIGAVKIPNVLWKMKRLRHLYFSWNRIINNGKLRLYGLRELETICRFESDTDEIADLLELINLRVLDASVKGDDNLYALMKYTNMNDQNLQGISLRIYNCDFNTEKGHDLLINILMCKILTWLEIEAKLVKFPSLEQDFLQSLTMLKLWENEMEEDSMEILGKLHQLRSLSLERNSYFGEYLICHEFDFPQLKYLELKGLRNLKYWRVDEGSMPNLFHLKIWSCKSLVMVPYGLQFAKGLKEVNFLGMPREFCERVRVTDNHEGEDYYKIQHVPSIRLPD